MHAVTHTVPSSRLAMSLAIAIDLGSAPTIGEYSSETVHTWSAAVPRGSFALTLSAIEGTAHGGLVIDQVVHAEVATDCGADITETVRLVF
jgi:hypothetical protein